MKMIIETAKEGDTDKSNTKGKVQIGANLDLHI
jgi:hypothetical protein